MNIKHLSEWILSEERLAIEKSALLISFTVLILLYVENIRDFPSAWSQGSYCDTKHEAHITTATTTAKKNQRR